MKTYIQPQITFKQIISTIHKNINKNNKFENDFVYVQKSKSIKQLLHIYKDLQKQYNKQQITENEVIEIICKDYNKDLN